MIFYARKCLYFVSKIRELNTFFCFSAFLFFVKYNAAKRIALRISLLVCCYCCCAAYRHQIHVMMKRFAATRQKKICFCQKIHTHAHTFIGVHAHCTVVWISRWSPADSIIWNKKNPNEKKTYVPNPSGVYLIAFFFVSVCAKKNLEKKEITCSEWRKSVNKKQQKRWIQRTEQQQQQKKQIMWTKPASGTILKRIMIHPKKRTNNNNNYDIAHSLCASKTHSSVKNRLWCVTISTHHPISINIVTNYQFLCSKT